MPRLLVHHLASKLEGGRGTVAAGDNDSKDVDSLWDGILPMGPVIYYVCLLFPHTKGVQHLF